MTAAPDFWTTLLAAFGLVLVLEGLVWALFPDVMRRALAMALEMPEGQIRVIGTMVAALGVGAVWLVLG